MLGKEIPEPKKSSLRGTLGESFAVRTARTEFSGSASEAIPYPCNFDNTLDKLKNIKIDRAGPSRPGQTCVSHPLSLCDLNLECYEYTHSQSSIYRAYT